MHCGCTVFYHCCRYLRENEPKLVLVFGARKVSKGIYARAGDSRGYSDRSMRLKSIDISAIRTRLVG